MKLEEALRTGGFRPEAKLPPARTTRIEPGDLADTWEKKPKGGAVVGLRLLSERDVNDAYDYAIKTLSSQDDPDNERVQQIFLEVGVARALCDPNDVKKPHPLFPYAEDIVPIALTRPTIERLWDEIEALHIESSQTFLEATDDELSALCSLLTPGNLVRLSSAQQGRIRRLSRFILTELDPDHDDASDTDQDWGEQGSLG